MAWIWIISMSRKKTSSVNELRRHIAGGTTEVLVLASVFKSRGNQVLECPERTQIGHDNGSDPVSQQNRACIRLISRYQGHTCPKHTQLATVIDTELLVNTDEKCRLRPLLPSPLQRLSVKRLDQLLIYLTVHVPEQMSEIVLESIQGALQTQNGCISLTAVDFVHRPREPQIPKLQVKELVPPRLL